MTVLMVATVLLTILSFVYYIFVHRRYNYWKRRNVPHLKPTPILGNYADFIFLKKNDGETTNKICQQLPKEPYIGAFFGTEPAFIPMDPEIIKYILTKDARYFNAREIQTHVLKEHFGHALFFNGGDEWKVLRHNMTPLFTSSKMKNMFHLVESCSYSFEDLLDREFKKSHEHEMRSIMIRFTLDVLGACGFGVDTNAMSDQDIKKNQFLITSNDIFKISNLRGCAVNARRIWPAFFYGLGFRAFPSVISEFFYKLVTGVCASRDYKPSSRHDFIDLLLGWKHKHYLTCDSYPDAKTGEIRKLSVKVDENLMVAQSMTFFAGGFETSATTLTWILYELAKDQAAQEQLLEEVDAYLIRHNNTVKDDAVTEMPFFEACLMESLRLYPVLGIITREVTDGYTLPSGLYLEKGMRIHIPIDFMHHNPEYFPEPKKFRPERFLPENKHNIKPYTFLPFGEGPRICLGMRFAKMSITVAIVTFFKKYRVELAEGMPREVALEPRAFIYLPKIGVQLRLVAREGWEQRVFNRNKTATAN